MGSASSSAATSDTIQASNNNAGQGGGNVYLNMTKSRIRGTGGGGGRDGSGGYGGVNINQTDQGTVDKAFALAQLSMLEAFGALRTIRTSENMAMDTMAQQVERAAQSDGGEGERLFKITAGLIGVVVVVAAVFGGRRGNV